MGASTSVTRGGPRGLMERGVGMALMGMVRVAPSGIGWDVGRRMEVSVL